MIQFKEPQDLRKPWVLSGIKDSEYIQIPVETTKYLKRYDVQAIDFLYQNYVKKFKGCILNEEQCFNGQLQISVFLDSFRRAHKVKFLVLVLCPDHMIIRWHYHLTRDAKLLVKIVGPETCFADIDAENDTALLLPFSNIQLAEPLADSDFFAVIVDHFDEVARRRILNKLCGDFNVALTHRNFYCEPDQKLQWQILTWCNPGSVGKLSDFYEMDNDNFANFRNSYRHWWFRLTQNYCESFEKISDEEEQKYSKTLSEWAIAHRINSILPNQGKMLTKRRQPRVANNSAKIKKEEILDGNINLPKERTYPEGATGSLLDDAKQNDELIKVENDMILGESRPTEVRRINKEQEKYAPCTDKKVSDEDDALLDFINNVRSTTVPPMDDEARILMKKKELMSQIYQDDDNNGDNFDNSNDGSDEDRSFFRSYI